LIGKDGSLRKLYVIKGYCSLSNSALKAVSEWRYAPTLINGSPVEVDTEIQVIYSLQH
jgi:outer membrane biosynthesis protein TonB